jgi:hypothetical protein
MKRLAVVVFLSLLPGCGGSPGVTMPPTTTAASTVHRALGSWMLPEAASEDLLYVVHEYTTDVSVYSYPAGVAVGSLSDTGNGIGDCVDKSGDVFIVNFDTLSEGLKLPGFRGHFPLCGEGSTNGQETSSCLSLGVPG